MKLQFTVKEGNIRLILIFAGWGMSEKPFSMLRLEGYDIAVVWDYRDLRLETSRLSGYADIYLFAWSFGVYMAARIIAGGALSPTMKIAVNGSLHPIHDTEGIPEAIFRGTLDNLSKRNVEKFYRRMCHDAEQFRQFMSHSPGRDVEELRDELSAIARHAQEETPLATDWDRVVIAGADRIFPPGNLRLAWAFNPRCRILDDGAHLPDWQTLIEQEIIDKRLVARRFARSAPTYDDNAGVQRHIAGELWRLWCEASQQPPQSILEAGFGTGLLTRLYLEAWKPYCVNLWDLAPTAIQLPAAGEIVAGDAEELIRQLPDNYFEAIASASTMQWFDSPERFLCNAARVLTPGGIIAISTFAPGNMREVAAVTNLPLRYYTPYELSGMVPEGCSLLTLRDEEVIVRFDSPLDVLRHLRLTGVNGVRHANVTPARFIARYPVADGHATLTYHPVYMIIKKNTYE